MFIARRSPDSAKESGSHVRAARCGRPRGAGRQRPRRRSNARWTPASSHDSRAQSHGTESRPYSMFQRTLPLPLCTVPVWPQMENRRNRRPGNEMKEQYLRTCRDLHPSLTKRKYRRMQDLGEIENDAVHIRRSRRLTYDDIEIFTRNRFLDVNMFGYWPTRNEIADDLKKREFDFPNLPGTEEQVIQDLLSVFRQIELVSVILRFVDKMNYGILSPPVEQVLGIGPTRDHREKYLLYVRNLRRIRDETNGLSTAADVDMALWVLSVGVLNEELNDESTCNRLREQYANDLLLREVRVENLTSQLFGELHRRELAEALNRCSTGSANELAGQIAGIEFEKSIKAILGTHPESRDGLWKLVQSACAQHRSVRGHQTRWESAVEIRNKLIHTNGQWSTYDVERLIEAMQEAHRLSHRTTPERGAFSS